jgi:predicted ATP-dependent endonuclease of OLD family
MKLTKIHFDAFKSLLNKELLISHDCIGFVGTNESGKSNVLLAINVLSGNRKLSAMDTPKMAKANNPSLRFFFRLIDKEIKEIENLIKGWCQQNTLGSLKSIEYSDLNVCYNIIFNKEKNLEQRFFTIDGFKLEDGHLVLKFEKLIDPFKIKHKESFVPLNKAIIIKESNILLNNKHKEICDELEKINIELLEKEKTILDAKEKHALIVERLKENEPNLQTSEGASVQSELTKEKDTVNLNINSASQRQEHLKKERDTLHSLVKEFNIIQLIDDAKHIIANGDQEISNIKSEINTLQTQVLELKKLTPPDTSNITTINKKIIDLNTRLKDSEERKNRSPKILEDLSEPLEQKYTRESGELNKHLTFLIQEALNGFLPKVVFWEHSDKYILQSETLFTELLNKKDLNDISRPLVNIFRIGLKIQTIEELKAKISEIQKDSNERSRLEKTLNKKINQYIKSVWQDYDQDINITLEKDQIRIEIFDPEHEEASYYNMQERSHGCQTFLSFLMTVSAEAEHGVITNTILLLDEPESHLHPSGVRFMLQELIKISERNNLVLYATHSIFLIDRKNYNRHIILEKNKEHTIIKPSNSGRIGYFMQEEVLYNTLDLDLSNDFTSTKKFNFVFEGDGDAHLFEYYYDKILQKESRPFTIDNTSFYQGGKCTDIQKYFNHRPIQLGTKWIFILDKDAPADGLKKFIEGKYKSYINNDIYVYQYVNEKKKANEIELEDLLPMQFIIETYQEVNKQLNYNISEKELRKHITEDSHYIDYSKIIKKKLNEDQHDIFQIKFKEVLNARIKKHFEDNRDVEGFKKAFPEYHNWVTDVISKLSNKEIPKK